MVCKGAPSVAPSPSLLLSCPEPTLLYEFARSVKQFPHRDEILSSFADNISRECRSALEEKHQRHAHHFRQRKEATYFR
jgi:hypothetical protein